MRVRVRLPVEKEGVLDALDLPEEGEDALVLGEGLGGDDCVHGGRHAVVHGENVPPRFAGLLMIDPPPRRRVCVCSLEAAPNVDRAFLGMEISLTVA